MEAVYILTGLATVAIAIGGLVLTCYLERRSLTSRRHHGQKRAAAPAPEDYRATT